MKQQLRIQDFGPNKNKILCKTFVEQGITFQHFKLPI